MDAIYVGYNQRYAIHLRQSYRRDHAFMSITMLIVIICG